MEAAPPLIKYATWQEYQEFYKREFCQRRILTHDGIPVYFSEGRFWHAFCTRDSVGKKDKFSFERAQYMGWICPTLQNPSALSLKGWDSVTKKIESHRRVSFVFGDFVVVVEMSLKMDGTLKAKFITAYYADRSINKIKQSPEWSLQECVEYLRNIGR
ncbi:MAG: hypothetical protein ABW189_01475 [Rickettsiales bacterium]